MKREFSDQQVVVVARGFVIAAGMVLVRLRDPEFLAMRSEPSSSTLPVEEPVPGEGGRTSRLRGLVKQGGDRARAGIASGYERWNAQRPGSAGWTAMGVEERVDWWLGTVGRLTAALAALPGLSGFVGDRLPVGDLISVAGQGLLLCAVAEEYGLVDQDAQVVLLGTVILARDLSDDVQWGSAADAREEATRLAPEIEQGAPTSRERAFAAASALIRMGRSLTTLQDELEKRPRGHLGQRLAGAVPVVGIVGQVRGEWRGLQLVVERGSEWCERHQIASPPPAPGAPALSAPPPGNELDFVPRAEVLEALRELGRTRQRRGDQFHETNPGHAFYVESGQRRVGIAVRGDGAWTVSVFAPARVGMEPTHELHRYVAAWRSTSDFGAPYVVERDGVAAVVCESTIDGRALADLATARRLITSTIDAVGAVAEIIGRDLAHADGVAFGVRGTTGESALRYWWEVRDERMDGLLRGH